LKFAQLRIRKPILITRGGWHDLTLQTTLQGAPLKLRLGGVFVDASCRHDPQFFPAPRRAVTVEVEGVWLLPMSGIEIP
jgi:hypothetical protein